MTLLKKIFSSINLMEHRHTKYKLAHQSIQNLESDTLYSTLSYTYITFIEYS